MTFSIALPVSFRAFRSRNYRLFAMSQFVSLIGTLMTIAATNWVTFEMARAGNHLFGAAFLVGVVIFSGQIPQLFLSPPAGAWIERRDRRRVLVVTQSLSMLQSLALAIFAFRNQMTFVTLVLLSFVQGCINAFDGPTRQALNVDLVDDRRDLPNAIALNSTMVHLSRLVGPAIAGLVIFKFGVGQCFLIDTFTYLPILFVLSRQQIFARAQGVNFGGRRNGGLWADLREGVRYAKQNRSIWIFIVLPATMSFFAMSEAAVLPEFTSDYLRGDECAYGLLISCSGVGALVASLYLARRQSVEGLEKVISWAAVSVGVTLISVASSREPIVAMIFNAFAGASLLLVLAGSGTLLQQRVHDERRGRVSALSYAAFLGMAPLGSLCGGAVASIFGAPVALLVAGVGCFVAGLVFFEVIAKENM